MWVYCPHCGGLVQVITPHQATAAVDAECKKCGGVFTVAIKVEKQPQRGPRETK